MEPTHTFLAPLRDVAGVFGSFFLDRSGGVSASDLPPMLGTELLREVGPRVLRLEETLGVDGCGPDSIVLRFDQQRLHLSFVPDGVFGVLTQHDVNAASLKMALTLAGRHLRESAGNRASGERPRVPIQFERSSELSDLPPDTRRSPVFSEPGRGSAIRDSGPPPEDAALHGRRIW